ncbi:hypothetical protein ACIDE9_07060 [Methylophilus sp. 'Pure River']|uniref:hypothetical protein n=1 Tax=Methylophilus sp. 'Pure River' TaxID=3377117 RepID=UPI00398E9782
MHTIKAIETRYNGYRFRSRLEARWAVFFGHAQIKYEYELEGFALPSGAAYLPDFYLPDFNLYVEIKPSERIKLQELRKIFEFSLVGDNHLLLIVGTPTQENMFLINRRHTIILEEFEGEVGDSGAEEDVVALVFNQLRKAALVVFGNTPLNKNDEWVLIYREAPGYPLINSALASAKEAQFEHGESA